jgi:MFS family permease
MDHHRHPEPVEFLTDHSRTDKAGTDRARTDKARTARSFALLGATQVSLIAAITLIAVPLPAIQREFQLTPTELALVSAAYGLSFGGLLLVGGRLADRLGARRTFVAGIAVFGASSLLGALSVTHAMMLGARFAQGIGAALVAPATIGLVARLYPDGSRRARAFAVWGTLSVTGAVTGSVLSGLIMAVSSWRATFLIPTVVAVVALAGARYLPAAPPRGAARPGIVDGTLATAGLVALSYGVLEAAPALIAAGVLALAGFLARQARVAQPLLPLGLVAPRRRGAALLVIWLTAAASATSTFLLSLFFQQIQDRTPALTSLAFLPFLLVVAMGPVSGWLMLRYGRRRVTTLGLLVAAASMALLSRLEVDSPYPGVVLAALLLFPVGSGLAFAGATVTALGDVPVEHSGVAGGVVNTALEIGPTIGLALLLALAAARTQALVAAGADVAAATTSGYAAALGASALAFLLTALVVRLTFGTDNEKDKETDG